MFWRAGTGRGSLRRKGGGLLYLKIEKRGGGGFRGEEAWWAHRGWEGFGGERGRGGVIFFVCGAEIRTKMTSSGCSMEGALKMGKMGSICHFPMLCLLAYGDTALKS